MIRHLFGAMLPAGLHVDTSRHAADRATGLVVSFRLVDDAISRHWRTPTQGTLRAAWTPMAGRILGAQEVGFTVVSMSLVAGGGISCTSWSWAASSGEFFFRESGMGLCPCSIIIS